MLPTFPALVTGLALLLYVGVFVGAGRARLRYRIQAPAVTGAPQFERAFRIQQNTLEQLIWLVPALWLFAFYVSPFWGGIIGLVWIAARIFYASRITAIPIRAAPALSSALRALRCC